MKQGKIKNIEPNGKWNDKSKYKVTFDNGDAYTFFALGDFNYIFVNYTDKNDLIIRQTCIKASAHYNAQRNVGVDTLINEAELMFNWIKS